MKLIGVISDTHGLLREETLQWLKEVDLILHAGDVGTKEVLEKLKRIAPVKAVRGNCDRDSWARKLPLTEAVEVDGTFIYMLHDLSKIDIDPVKSGFDIVISGHTHSPKEEKKDNVLYLNPGSVGRRRFNLPLSMAHLIIDKQNLNIRMVKL